MGKRSPRRGTHLRGALVLSALLLAVAGFPARAVHAVLIPGGGTTASDCLVALDLAGGDSAQVQNGKKVTCVDGDPCDADAQCNDTCTFDLAICANQAEPAGCTAPSALTSLTVKAKGQTIPVPGLSGASCGERASIAVPLKGKKRKPGKLKIKATAKQSAKPKKDADKFQLVCTRREGACPTTTSTSTSTTSTTIPAAVCGNGTVEDGETCDPPCSAGCGGGEICNDQCQCVAAVACACGSPEPEQLAFRTVDGTGVCGDVLDANGMSLTVNAPPNDTPGLNCAGLYFGGRGNSVPLPNSVPNNGMSVTNVCCSGTELFATGATAEETGSERNCTAPGCLFGAPLPVVNPTNPGTSTCVINRLAAPIRGRGDCVEGSSSLDAPLSSEIFLAGDRLFNCLVGDTDPPGLACGSDADCGPGGICPTGIQPCPLCTGPSGNETCFGGPNNGMACTPETTTAGDPFPTSHDCPPSPADTIGSIPIAFSLTTGTAERTAQSLGTERVFCGFCRDADDSLCFEGNTRFKCGVGPNVGDPCTTLGPDDPACGGGLCETNCPLPIGTLHPCDSNDDCAQPYESCEQNQPGAFSAGGGGATTVRLIGTPAGDTTDRQEHASTLVGVFCIPPTFDAIIDAAGNLPGPGAVSLPGFAQLLPADGGATTTTSSTTTSTTP